MSKKQVISCQSRDEMMKIADRLTRQGLIVRTAARMTPFHPEGLCVPEYKVIVQDEPEEEKRAGGPGFLKRILRKITWKSDLQKTSALSGSSAL